MDVGEGAGKRRRRRKKRRGGCNFGNSAEPGSQLQKLRADCLFLSVFFYVYFVGKSVQDPGEKKK